MYPVTRDTLTKYIAVWSPERSALSCTTLTRAVGAIANPKPGGLYFN